MGVVHATIVYDYEKQDRSAHRSIYDNEYFPVLLYLTLTAIRDSRQIYVLFFERRSIVDKLSVPSHSHGAMAYASHRHRSSLDDNEVGKSNCLPPSSNEASGLFTYSTVFSLLKPLPSSTKHQPTLHLP